MEKGLEKALDKAKSNREKAVLLTLAFPEKNLNQLIGFLKNRLEILREIMNKPNERSRERFRKYNTGVALPDHLYPPDKKIGKDLLYIQKNILNQGPLAGMDIHAQIDKINSILKNWLQANLSKRGV